MNHIFDCSLLQYHSKQMAEQEANFSHPILYLFLYWFILLNLLSLNY
jgi:hypothetical protein